MNKFFKRFLIGFGIFIILLVILGSIGSSSQKSHLPTNTTTQSKPATQPKTETQVPETSQSLSSFFLSPKTSELSIAGFKLQTFDIWNEETGYYLSLAPSFIQTLSDSQMKIVLKAIRDFRKTQSDKWFDITIYDDPEIAKTARESALKNSDMPEKQWCQQIFSHYRGVYSWNPTTQYEQMSINQNCEWVSVK